MSVPDGEGQLSGSSRNASKRPAWFWVAVIGLVVLATVVAVMSAGLLDPLPKRAILKAGEMDAMAGMEGSWEQTSLHCFEDDLAPPFSSQRAAHSIMYFSNDTSHLAVAITVAQMHNTEEANKTYAGWVNYWSGSKEASMKLEVGEEGLFSGYANLNNAREGAAYLHFHKGTYVVEMYFQGNIGDLDVYREMADGQAARL